ncbi:hypothetical protein ACFVH6_00655 [Spirillospora sp. NPDC127200]
MRRIAQGLGGAVMAAGACGLLSTPLLMWTLGVAMAPDRRWMPPPPSLGLVLVIAVGCAGLCLGVGAVLLLRGPRALGGGLVGGWAVIGLLTSGWAVGLAPDLYAPERRYDAFADRFTGLPPDEAGRRAEAELRTVLRLAGGRAGEARRAVRPGGCWAYRGRDTGLVEPPGSGVVQYTATVEVQPAQPVVDRVATGLAREREAVGRRHEAVFESRDGVITELLAGDGDTGVLVAVRTPCLHRLG